MLFASVDGLKAFPLASLVSYRQSIFSVTSPPIVVSCEDRKFSTARTALWYAAEAVLVVTVESKLFSNLRVIADLRVSRGRLDLGERCAVVTARGNAPRARCEARGVRRR